MGTRISPSTSVAGSQGKGVTGLASTLALPPELALMSASRTLAIELGLVVAGRLCPLRRRSRRESSSVLRLRMSMKLEKISPIDLRDKMGLVPVEAAAALGPGFPLDRNSG